MRVGRLALRLYADLQVRTGPKKHCSAVFVWDPEKPLPTWLHAAANIDTGTCDWVYPAKEYDRVLVYRPNNSFSVFSSAYESITALRANNVLEADVHLEMGTGKKH